MPRVISDELFDQLMGCVKQQRLLGVMGMLERLQKDARKVEAAGEFANQKGWTTFYQVKEIQGGQKQQTNSN